MTDIKKNKIKSVFKYTWWVYIVTAIIVGFGISFLFGITHRIPAYKTITLFVTGEVADTKRLNDNLVEKYKDKELKSVTSYATTLNDGNYYNRLSVIGYNSSDVLILPVSVLENLNISTFGLELDDNLKTNYYAGYDYYVQNEVSYGVRINRELVKDDIYLPKEDCYMIINAKSASIGEYSKDQIKERNTTLTLVKDWGM